MIKTYYKTPQIYSNSSRDFQLLGHIYDAIFNYSKTAIDMIYNNPVSANSDNKLLDLVIKTLGFESKHEYNAENLKCLANSFKKIINIKGTKESIEFCIQLLLRAQGIYQKSYVDISLNTGDYNNSYIVYIYVPYVLKDIILLEDMLDYILPAGFVYELYQVNLSDIDMSYKPDILTFKDKVTTTEITQSLGNDTFHSVIIGKDQIDKFKEIGEEIDE